MYAMLGDVHFDMRSSFTALEEQLTANFAKHEVMRGKPRLQAMGEDLATLRFSLHLDWRLGDVDEAYDGLKAALSAQEALALVYGSGRFVGWFVLASMTCRTLQQDASGRTAARDIDVELTEFAGDPNNILETPGVMSGLSNPLLAMLPESVRGVVSDVAAAVQKGVAIYNQVQNTVAQVQDLVGQAQALFNDPAALLGLAGDMLGLAGSSLGALGGLADLAPLMSGLAGAQTFLAQTAQAARQLSDAVGWFDNAVSGNTEGDWFASGSAAVAAAAQSLDDASAAAAQLTAWLAVRKE